MVRRLCDDVYQISLGGRSLVRHSQTLYLTDTLGKGLDNLHRPSCRSRISSTLPRKTNYSWRCAVRKWPQQYAQNIACMHVNMCLGCGAAELPRLTGVSSVVAKICLVSVKVICVEYVLHNYYNIYVIGKDDLRLAVFLSS